MAARGSKAKRYGPRYSSGERRSTRPQTEREEQVYRAGTAERSRPAGHDVGSNVGKDARGKDISYPNARIAAQSAASTWECNENQLRDVLVIYQDRVKLRARVRPATSRSSEG
jgi:hypothetical protein